MLEVTPAPPIADPAPLQACDTDNDGVYTMFDLHSKDAEVTLGNTDLIVSYHPTPSDAANGLNPLAPGGGLYTNVVPGQQTVYVRVKDTTSGCILQTTLSLEVYPRPETDPPENLSQCDTDGDGVASFDLTQAEEDLFGGPPSNDYAFSYYETLSDAQSDQDAITGPGSYENETNPDSIYVRTTDITSPASCYSVEGFAIEVFPLPDITQPDTLSTCDDMASGSTTDQASVFDLTQTEGLITGGDPSLSVSWHATDDPTAIGPGNAIADPTAFENTVPGAQTVSAKVTSEHGCSAFTTLTLIVSPLPSPTPLDQQEPYVVCDDDNDGFANFDLSTRDSIIANDEANVDITYYPTPQAAEAGNPQDALPEDYINTSPGTDTIYARATNTVTGCFSYVPVVLEVQPKPEAGEPQDLFNCQDASGTATFDLTQNNSLIYNGQPTSDYSLSYHQTQAGAQAGTDPIATPTAYPVDADDSPATVWARLEGQGQEGCYDTVSFQLEVGDQLVINTPDAQKVCEGSAGTLTDGVGLFNLTLNDSLITGGNNSLGVSYYESADSLANDTPIATPTQYTNPAGQNPMTLFVEVEGPQGCTATTTLTVVVLPAPSLPQELDTLYACDPDNDGFAPFDLSGRADHILNGEPNVSITFHTSLADAQDGVGAIDTTQAYTNTVAGGQTIYVRAVNTGPSGNDGTGCSVTRELRLEVEPSPEILDLDDRYRCDDEPYNGFAPFDLTIGEDSIIGDQDASGLTITYYETLADAQAGTNPIAVPSNYTNIANPQTIYVRLTDTVSGCYDTFDGTGLNSFTLNVIVPPDLSRPTALRVCDDGYDQTPFAQTTFDLTTKIEEITGYASLPPGLEVTFYEGLDELEAGQAIADPENYVNAANPQTVYIEVVDTGAEIACPAQTRMTLEVLPLPSPSETDGEALDLVQCDDDNDGVAAQPFDLTQSGALIAGGEDVSLEYYTDSSAAVIGSDTAGAYIEFPGNYVNEPALNVVDPQGNVTNRQTIYVRVESGATGNPCFVIVTFDIRVVPAPVLNPLGDPFGYTLCGTGNTDQAPVDPFDITRNLYRLQGGGPANTIPLLDPGTDQDQDIDHYDVTYYTSEQDAEAGVDPVGPGTVVQDGDTLYIRVEYEETNCYNTGEIGKVVIEVQPRPVANPVQKQLVVCSDEPGGSSATVDLTQFDGAINPNPAGTFVEYYANSDSLDAGSPIDNPASYTTVSDPQTVVAVVRDGQTLCESPQVAEIEIIINQRPVVDISEYDGSVICRDINPVTPVQGGDYTPVVIETGLSAQLYDFQWSRNGSTLAEDGPSLEVGTAGEYTVTVTRDGTGCQTSASVTVVESNPPEFTVLKTSSPFEGEHSAQVGNVIGSGDYEFRIDNGPWIDADSTGTIVFDGLSAGTHIIYGRDEDGCGVTLRPVSFIGYPDFFTPNNDGYNDSWNVTGLKGQPGAKIYIFNRYGKLLKQLSPTGPGWDGTYNGQPVPSNDYWFRVEYIERMPDGTTRPAVFKGNFTLKR